MGLEPTPDEFVAGMVEVFREVRRVLRDDGTLWLNIGDSYAGYHGNKNSEVPTSATNGWTNGTNENARTSTANRNGLKPKDLIGIPWMLAFALRADGWYLRQDIIWSKPNPMPESVRDRCTKAHEYLFLLSKGPRYYFDDEAIREESLTGDLRRPYGSPGANMLDPRGKQGEGKMRAVGRATDTYTAHAYKTPQSAPRGPASNFGIFEKRNKRSVWTVNTAAFADAHFATYPPALIEPCILAGCPEGGTVLDPFFGAGTTGLVARRLGRNAIGIELNPEYAAIARRRLEQDEMGEHSRKRARAAIKAEAAAPIGGLFA